MPKKNDLTKVTVITIIGFCALMGSLFWLKGYKFHSQKKIVAYFEDVGGLEEGSIVRWSGLRVGVVEQIEPILRLENKNKAPKENNKYTDLQEKDKKLIRELNEKLVKANESESENIKKQISTAQTALEIHELQAEALRKQEEKISNSHVKVTLVITKKDVPLGPISRVSIVPSGLIGDHFVEITPTVYKKHASENFEPVFLTQEPLRFERLLKANVESSEAFKEAITKINQLIKDEDVTLLRATVTDVRAVVTDVNKLINNAGQLLVTTSEKLNQLADSSNQLSASVVAVGQNINQIIGDDQIKQDLKTTSASLRIITSEIAQLLDEEGLAKDIKEIAENAKETSTEVSGFVSDARKTQAELELPKTIANLNSLAEKLDTLTNELNQVVADEEVKDDIKITIKRARETSENLQKVSKKLNKRFLLWRLLF